MLNGEEEAQKSQESAKALFSAGNAENMPTAELSEADFIDGKIDILAVLQKSELVPSRAEGRRAVEQGGVTVDGEKVSDVKMTVDVEKLKGDGIIVKRGKKNFRRVFVG